MCENHGEVTRVEVCSSTFASDAPNLLDAFAREAEGRGGIQFRIVDANFPALVANGSRVDVTWQQLQVWKDGGDDVRVLAKPRTDSKMPVSHLQCAGDCRSYTNLPEAVDDGLKSFEDLGTAANIRGGERPYGSDTTAYEGPHKEKVSSFSVLDNLRFMLGLSMCFMGITVGLMYVATALTYAAMHKENGEFESLNFNSLGSPKFWVFIPKLWTRKLRMKLLKTGGDELLQKFFDKELFLPTTLLEEWGIPYYTATQMPGWFVLTTGYHQVSHPCGSGEFRILSCHLSSGGRLRTNTVSQSRLLLSSLSFISFREGEFGEMLIPHAISLLWQSY